MRVFYILAISCLICFSACKKDVCVGASSNISTRILTVDEIKTVIHKTDAFDLKITQGPTQEIKVTGPDNLLDNVRTAVVDDVWEVNITEADYCDGADASFQVELITPVLNKIQNNSDRNISVGVFVADSNFYLENNGAGSIQIDSVEAYYMELAVNNSGHIDIKGNATFVDYLLDGKGNINAFDLITFDGYARNKNQSNINLHVTSDLNAIIDGSGNICYKGNPNISPVINGTGSIIDKN